MLCQATTLNCRQPDMLLYAFTGPAKGKFNATIGARVMTPCGLGTVLFRGDTEFAKGEWVGVELDGAGELFAQRLAYVGQRTELCWGVCAGGKHDGEVAGKRYFSTTPGCGLFVKAESLQG